MYPWTLFKKKKRCIHGQNDFIITMVIIYLICYEVFRHYVHILIFFIVETLLNEIESREEKLLNMKSLQDVNWCLILTNNA